MEDKEVKMETVSVQDAEKITNQESVANDDAVKRDAGDVVDDSAEKIAKLTEDLAAANDRILRLAAELENTRRRATLDAESRARTRAMGVAEKLLPVMDAVLVALKHSPEDEGMKSLLRALESSFAQIGIVKIESVGAVMNPMFHNAIQVVPVPEGGKPNTIVEELQSGYMFGDSVLRTAMVVVAK